MHGPNHRDTTSTPHASALFTAASISAPRRRIKFRNAIPDECLKFLVAHVGELVYMGALDLLHVEAHEFATLHFRSDGRAQLTRRPCRGAKALQLAHVSFKREDCFNRLTSLN